MWYVLLKLLSVTSLLFCEYESVCVRACVGVCVCVKPNPSWNADLMRCLTLTLAEWCEEAERQMKREAEAEGGDSQFLLWAFVMEACSADELALPAAYRRRPAPLLSVPSLPPCFILGHRTGPLGWFNSLSLAFCCSLFLSDLVDSNQFLMCFFQILRIRGCLKFAVFLKQTGLCDVLSDLVESV